MRACRRSLLQGVARSRAALPPRLAGAARAVAGSSGRTADVVIVGGGILGSSCALELRKAGFTTVNIDTNPSPGYGSTSSSSGIIRQFYSLEDSCRLAWDSYHYWKSWADYLEASPGEELSHMYEIGGAVIDCPSNPSGQAYLANIRKSMNACGVPVEYWDVAEVQRRMPFVSSKSYFPPRRITDERFGEENGSEISGMLYCAQSGYINDPQLAARNIADAAARRGAAFRWRSNVVAVNHSSCGSKVAGVSLQDGSTIEAPIVINAAGPHSQSVHDLAFSGARVEDDSLIGSKPLKVEVAYLQEPPGTNLDQTMPFIADLDTGCYIRPQHGGQIVIGSIEPECDELHFKRSADDLDGLSDQWTNNVYRAALRLPGMQVPNTASGLSALYDTTPDWVPIYDRTSLGGFYSIRGTSGNQFKNAPLVGKICAKLVDGCENGHDHDADPLTLPLMNVDGHVRLSIFSRLRNVQDTSGSVLS